MRVVLTLLSLLLITNNAFAVNEQTNDVKIKNVLHVVYPKAMRSDANEMLYPLVILDEALKNSGYKYTLSPSKIAMAQSRSLKQIKHGDEVNVAWSMTSQDREAQLLPVRIPLFKGLYGWRLLLTTPSHFNSLLSITGLDDLKKIHFIQGHDWPDTQILIDNGLTVSTSIEYLSLFNMLKKGRGEVFPRSILEIRKELSTIVQGSELKILPHVLLYYPTAMYFFFNKDQPDIAHAVEKGLNIMLQNGQFDQIFNAYHLDNITHANIPNSLIIKLKNEQLPAHTPLNDKRLWFNEKTLSNKAPKFNSL